MHNLILLGENKARLKLHKDIYSLDSIKQLLDEQKPLLEALLEDKDYWKLELDTSSLKDIMRSFNYLLYLNRKNES